MSRVHPVPGQPAAGRSRAVLTLFALVLVAPLLAPSPACAAESAPPMPYPERVTEARILLEAALAEEPLSEQQAVALAERLGALLPQGERVEAGSAAVTVDDSQFAGLLGRLERDPQGAVGTGVPGQILAHLRSLEAASVRRSGDVPADRAALERLLADRTGANRSSISNFFGDLVDRLGRMLVAWWESLGASPAVGRTLTTITIVVLAAITLLLAAILVRAFIRARGGTARAARRSVRAPDAGPVVSAAADLPDDPLAHADALAAAGDFRTALRSLFGGAARSLQEAGLVRQPRTHTNGELLGEVRATGGAVIAQALDALRVPFERAWYGHHDPEESAFAAAREEYLALISAIAGLRERDVA